ncbi:SMC domain protein (plasmid) [Emticicia oligotrophica DSM 17448]|uniref:SMC domain protein n=1 Tax=Emticicia oligotrophica (strain DSM 17448 / CIP 109782 / MTCC 6937 / GPTSA100-15) TaxID=929562 RepID=A0ABM5N7H0_EMTOG|nr:AAA family ATPase [Emticicia oligotrophica]AFK05462.1 SMC domain protein [Emticicia oligotrophica DSM 17448]
MLLKQLSLRNFRGLDETSISFINDTGKPRLQTLLLGENGTGKSTILKAIALIGAGSNSLSELLGNPDEWISFGENSCEIKAVFMTKEKKPKEREISLKINRGDSIKDILVNNTDSLDEIDRALSHTDRNYFILGYGASRRLNKNQSFNQPSSFYNNDRSANVATLFNSDANLYPLSAWVMELDYRSDGEALESIKNALNEFLINIRFDSIDKQQKTLLFSNGKDLIPIHLLSDGYQNVSGWIGDLLYRIFNTFGDRQNPLMTNGILLIDEIDLHLHPTWQRRLLGYLKTKLPNFQIIASTHSPLTAQQAGEGELIVLNRTKNNQIDAQLFKGTPNKMLLHQVLLSPIFGVQSDESYETEQLKNEYENLKNRKGSKAQADKLSKRIQAIPQVTRTNMVADAGLVDLLNKINQELQQ